MAREELARLLSCLLKRGQSARCCDDLAEFKSRLFAELLHWKNSFRWFRFLLLRGTAESGALKANALPGGARRLAVRAVKGACFSRLSERSGRPLTGGAGGPGAGFQREGQKGETTFNEVCNVHGDNDLENESEKASYRSQEGSRCALSEHLTGGMFRYIMQVRRVT